MITFETWSRNTKLTDIDATDRVSGNRHCAAATNRRPRTDHLREGFGDEVLFDETLLLADKLGRRIARRNARAIDPKEDG